MYYVHLYCTAESTLCIKTLYIPYVKQPKPNHPEFDMSCYKDLGIYQETNILYINYHY